MSAPTGLTWHGVVSSNLSAVAYDETDNTLYVEFKDGGVYAYDDADESLFIGLLDASSPGSYFAKLIRSLPTRKLS